MIQIVEFTGVPGLSFLVALTNVILVATVRRFIDEARVKQSRPHFEFTLTMAAIVGVMGYGVRAVQTERPAPLPRRGIATECSARTKIQSRFRAGDFR